MCFYLIIVLTSIQPLHEWSFYLFFFIINSLINLNFRFWNSLLDSVVISLTLLIGCKCVVDVCLLMLHSCIQNIPEALFPIMFFTSLDGQNVSMTKVLALACFHATDGSATLFSPCIRSLPVSLSLSLSHPHQPCPNCTLCCLSVHNINNPCICRRISWLSLCMLFEKSWFTGSI